MVFHTELEGTLSMQDNNFLHNRVSIAAPDGIALQNYTLLQISNKVLVISGVKEPELLDHILTEDETFSELTKNCENQGVL